MNKCKLQQTNYLRSNSNKKLHTLESNNESDKSIDDTNVMMKTPQSLDDLLDVDDNNYQNEDEREETENDDDEDDDEDDSIQYSIDDTNRTDTTRQKKSIKKNGKLQQLVK
ncbi:hypothetical protein I4U23_009982 [Adineta vaga]|nr:hypothetical protein I4U23_009982 [Adineta vaga]